MTTDSASTCIAGMRDANRDVCLR